MLNIAAVQFDIQWESPAQNRKILDPIIRAHSAVDVVILPEMFSSGFSTAVDVVAENHEGVTVQWMQNLAKELDIAICGSIPTKLGKHFVNRFYWVESHRVLFYDKKHLFGYGKESEVYSAGTEHLIVQYKGWKIMPLICYDLRFPVWSRNTQNYDLLLYVANWPNTRASAWRLLLKARAIENLCFVCGVNRIGTDGAGLEYIGDSAVIDFMGNEMASLPNKTGVLQQKLSRDEMLVFRNKFNFLNDRDNFDLV